MTDAPGKPDTDPPIDWTLSTFEGARREQLRRWSKLSLRQILMALEEMDELSRRLGSPPQEDRSRGDNPGK